MRIGDLVKLDWVDIAGYTNEPQEKAILCKAVNIGVVVEKTKKFIKLQTGFYSGDNVGDYTVFPVGCIDRVEVLESGYRKRCEYMAIEK